MNKIEDTVSDLQIGEVVQCLTPARKSKVSLLTQYRKFYDMGMPNHLNPPFPEKYWSFILTTLKV